MTGPSSVEAGVAQITFKNSTKKGGGAPARRDRGRPHRRGGAQGRRGLGRQGQGAARVDALEGGVRQRQPGQDRRRSPSRWRRASTWRPTSIQRRRRVRGDGRGIRRDPSDRPPHHAVDYSFNTTGLKAGEVRGGLRQQGQGAPLRRRPADQARQDDRGREEVIAEEAEDGESPPGSRIPSTRTRRLRHRRRRRRRQAGARARAQEGQVRPPLLHPRPRGRPAARGEGDGLRGVVE